MFLYSREMELSGSSIKKFLIFSPKKSLLVFRETETPRKFFIFKEMERKIAKTLSNLFNIELSKFYLHLLPSAL